jgi:ribonuclease-3
MKTAPRVPLSTASAKAAAVEKKLGYSFRDIRLLEKALTHSSYAYEKQSAGVEDNERLEFLGDSVVGLIIAEYFYSGTSDKAEGELSKLKSSAVSTLALAGLARKVRLEKGLLLGRGEEKSGGKKKISILAGVFEAVVGAIYLDGGLQAAKSFLLRLLDLSLKSVPKEPFVLNNYKSALQEMFQKEGLPAPLYRTVTEKGPDHEKTFIVEVCLEDHPLAKAKGRSKKSAEQRAAEKALRAFLGRKMKPLTAEAFFIKE